MRIRVAAYGVIIRDGLLEQVPGLRRVELVDVALNRWRTAAAR